MAAPSSYPTLALGTAPGFTTANTTILSQPNNPTWAPTGLPKFRNCFKAVPGQVFSVDFYWPGGTTYFDGLGMLDPSTVSVLNDYVTTLYMDGVYTTQTVPGPQIINTITGEKSYQQIQVSGYSRYRWVGILSDRVVSGALAGDFCPFWIGNYYLKSPTTQSSGFVSATGAGAIGPWRPLAYIPSAASTPDDQDKNSLFIIANGGVGHFPAWTRSWPAISTKSVSTDSSFQVTPPALDNSLQTVQLSVKSGPATIDQSGNINLTGGFGTVVLAANAAAASTSPDILSAAGGASLGAYTRAQELTASFNINKPTGLFLGQKQIT